MCDFSLQHAKSRPAVVGDKLVTHNFGRGTIGFKSVDDPIGDATAVCILPGTELAFDKPIKLRWSYYEGKGIEGRFTTAIFRQRDKDKPNVHHDVLEMPDGQQILLTHLEEGQNATVLQLPGRSQDREGDRGAEAGRVRRLKDSSDARWTRSFVYGSERRRFLETAAALLVPAVA